MNNFTAEFLQKQNYLGTLPSMKAIQIMLALAHSKDSMSIQEISAVTFLSQSTVHRILQELIAAEYVTKDDLTKRYLVGTGLFELAMTVRTSHFLINAAAEGMQKLNEITKETIHLIISIDNYATYLYKIDCKLPIGLQSKVGNKIPLYCTSGGKMLLAYAPDDWKERYFRDTELVARTSNTITNIEKLKAELETIRKQGYSIDECEHNPEVRCIAAPLFIGQGTAVGAISIAAPQYRFSHELALSYTEDLVRIADDISAKIIRNG